MGIDCTILDKVGRFSDKEKALFKTKLTKRVCLKNDILLNEGEVCQSVFYIASGSAYQFFYNEIEENIIGLHIEKEWCLNYFSFINQRPSEAIIKAYSDIEVIELSTTSIHELIAESESFFQLGKILEQTVSRIKYFDDSNTALQKYNRLFSSNPELFQRFPLKMIASYIKVAPETLSRIRNHR